MENIKAIMGRISSLFHLPRVSDIHLTFGEQQKEEQKAGQKVRR